MEAVRDRHRFVCLHDFQFTLGFSPLSSFSSWPSDLWIFSSSGIQKPSGQSFVCSHNCTRLHLYYSLPLQWSRFFPPTLIHPSYHFTMNNIKMSYHNWDYRVAQLYMPIGEDKDNLLIRISMLSKYGGNGQANTHKANNCAIT